MLIAKRQENRMDTGLFGKWSATAHNKYCYISFKYRCVFFFGRGEWGGVEVHGVYSLWLQGNRVWRLVPQSLFLFKTLNVTFFFQKYFGHVYLKHSICKSSR